MSQVGELPQLESRGSRVRGVDGPTGPASQPPSRESKQPRDVQGKIHRLEERVYHQDKVNTYLMEQLNKFEARIQKMSAKGISSFDEKRLELLEQELQRQDTEFRKLEDRVNISYSEYRGVDSKLRGMQRQEDSELTQLRSLIQEKFHEDQKLHLKNKEKAQVLFSEMVRIGELNEKHSTMLNSMGGSLEQRLNMLESRLNQGETAVSAVTTKNDSGVNMLIDLAEKVEKRVQMIETALFALNNEQLNDHKAIDRVESGSRRLQDDVKSFLRQLQGDIQHRLELKMSELLSKLLQEQEERLRNNQDLKYTFEVKDKMLNEKLQFNRDEFRDRLMSLESFLKTELQRKEDAINNLQTALDGQIRSVYETIKHEENGRMHHYNGLRDELAELSDATRDALEQQKSYQTAMTDKITEMVKTEIECRSKAEKELKNLIQSTIKGLMQEISNMKDNQEQSKLQVDYEVKESQNSFAEKADMLSRYFEDEIRRISALLDSQQNQTKGMITTLTESLKHTILSNEKWKGDANKKFGKLDRGLTHIKSELSRADTVNEGRIILKMKELQGSLESHLASNSKLLEERVETLAGMIDTSLGTFEKDILYNREAFSNILNQLNKEISEQHGSVCEDLKNLLGGLEALQNEIDSVSEETQDKLANVERQVALIESHSAVQLTTEKLMREHVVARLSQDIEEQLKDTEMKLEKIDERLGEEEKIQQGNDDRNLEKFNELSEHLDGVVQAVEAFRKEFGEKGNEDFEAVVQSYFVLQEAVSSLEAAELSDQVKALALNVDMKEMEAKAEGLAAPQPDLTEVQAKIREENKAEIQEAVERKLVKMQEALQKNNQAIWQEVVKSLGQLKDTSSLTALSERINQLALNSSGTFRPQIRF